MSAFSAAAITAALTAPALGPGDIVKYPPRKCAYCGLRFTDNGARCHGCGAPKP